MRESLRLLLPVLLLLVVAPRHLHAEDEPTPKQASVFSDQALLDKHLAGACDVVEAIEGRPFDERPTIRVSTPDEIAAVLVKEFEVMPTTFIAPEQREPLAKSIAPLLMAKYEPARNIVHIVPPAIEMIEKAQPKLARLGEDHLRVLLAHEVTHAMDFRRYDIMGMRAKLTDNDAQQALNAVVEGHAQFVAEKAAVRWKLMPAFTRLTEAIVGAPTDEGTAAEQAMRATAMAQIRFAYVQGHDFFRAVEKARGAKGVEAAMRTPPARSRQIEQPALWLDPSTTKPKRSLKDIANAFSWLVPPKGWIMADQRVLAAALEGQRGRVPEARRAEWLTGFDDAHVWQAQLPAKGWQVVVVVCQFDSPAHAALFAELDRLIVEHAKAPPGVTFETKALTDGAGPENRFAGFFMHRIVKVAAQSLDMRQQVMVHGDVAIETIVMGAEHIDRPQVDLALARLAAWIDDPEAAAKLPAPKTPTPKPDAATPQPTPEQPEKPAPVEEPRKDAPAEPVRPGK